MVRPGLAARDLVRSPRRQGHPGRRRRRPCRRLRRRRHRPVQPRRPPTGPLPAPLDLLPAVADAVGSRLDVFIDGGIRSGGDIAAALALGAKACLIGRPYVYGLIAAGEPGVAKVISILREELERTMRLLGANTLADLDRSLATLRP
ncbi:alpha-hydroxy-acid oxidizing protein [Kutzneria buriramensis]